MVQNEDFTTNMLRMICGTLFYSASLQTAREMYGKSYFALGLGEKAVVDQSVFAQVAANYQSVTAENLASQATPKPAGFQVQSSTSREEAMNFTIASLSTCETVTGM
jgi:hypothetical protein